MKNFFTIILTILACSCSKYVWITEHAFRPKKPKFSILKQSFTGNSLINNSYLYISKKKFPNFDGRNLIRYFGFYSDGRMIVDDTWENEMSATISTWNSWQNAATIGYYTTTNDRIRFQFFQTYYKGTYRLEEGRIKQDTIILESTTYFRLKKETELDTLIKSSYPLK